MAVRGVRGATVVNEDSVESILLATQELLQEIQKANPSLDPKDVASCIFTTTEDLKSEFPAKAARQLGWTEVPLLCAQEIPVVNSLKKCIRVLIHWNTNLSPDQINHVYLREAAGLRPEWASTTFYKQG